MDGRAIYIRLVMQDHLGRIRILLCTGRADSAVMPRLHSVSDDKFCIGVFRCCEIVYPADVWPTIEYICAYILMELRVYWACMVVVRKHA
jgi:hypothetical protein